MTDIKQCPACGGKNDVTASKCSSCGYDISMEAKMQYTLTLTATNCTISGATNGDKYPRGRAITMLATPSAHYQFSKWTKDGVDYSIDPQITVTIQKSVTYVAICVAQKVVTIDALIGSGTVYFDGEDVTAGATKYVDDGTSHTLLAVGDANHIFGNWGNPAGWSAAEKLTNPITKAVTANITISPTIVGMNAASIVIENSGDGVVRYYAADAGTVKLVKLSGSGTLASAVVADITDGDKTAHPSVSGGIVTCDTDDAAEDFIIVAEFSG